MPVFDAPFALKEHAVPHYPHAARVVQDLPSPLSVSSDDTSSASDIDTLAFPVESPFAATRSRVVRLFNLPSPPEMFLGSVFASSESIYPTPISMWSLARHPDPTGSVWAVFQSHQQARALLSVPPASFSVAPALERDLEPFHKLRRVDFPPMYTLSSNPPNPRASFRLGDWICPSPNCAAHNFGRNLACIGCGTARTAPSLAPQRSSTLPASLTPGMDRNLASPLPSPRFSSSNSATSAASPVSPSFPFNSHSESGNAHPLLTPSGRTFAVGGRVRNVSRDPMTPCVMFWPDNEPLPEQGQIRPASLVGVSQPPILNTGNRGPISHQPGDWICQKCNYLNWRRRKVCQTCLPYAEGNGDSISPAVQAERIGRLMTALSKLSTSDDEREHEPFGADDQLSWNDGHVQRERVSSAPHVNGHSIGPEHPPRLDATRLRTRSQDENGGILVRHHQRQHPVPAPPPAPRQYTPNRGLVYETSAPAVSAPAPVRASMSPMGHALLPSFLQDMVQSPYQVVDQFDEKAPFLSHHTAARTRAPAGPNSNGTVSSADSSPLSSTIWRLDGMELKGLSSRSSSSERA